MELPEKFRNLVFKCIDLTEVDVTFQLGGMQYARRLATEHTGKQMEFYKLDGHKYYFVEKSKLGKEYIAWYDSETDPNRERNLFDK